MARLRALLPVALAALGLGLASCGGPDESERERAIAAALDAYARAEAEGVDFSPGPCLGLILEGWVADVAHDPRQEVDDDPENQCEAFRSGEADHFVELDPAGSVIRVR